MTARLLEWSIRAVLMAGGTAAVLRLLRIRSASARHAAWTSLLAVMLLMPAWIAWGPKVALPILPERVHDALEPILPKGEILQGPRRPAMSSVPVQRGSTTPGAPEPAPAWPWAGIVLACYFAGAGVMLVRLIVGTVRVHSLVHRARAEGGIFTSPECAAPVSVGWFRPVILLPPNWRSWPAAELDAVLIHEREHVRRRDPLIRWLALLDRAIFWFHPLAWWLERKLAELAEDACDAAVLRRGHDPRLYSEYLIELARAVNRAGARLPAWGAAIDGGALASRIQRILDGGPIQVLSRTRATAAVALCAMALTTFGACNLQGAQKPAAGQLSIKEMQKQEAAEREKKAAEEQPPGQSDKVLFERGMDAMKHKHFDIARLAMQTLINTYPDSEYLAWAKLSIADSWYAEGGTAALAQAEQEYEDFETFFPNMPEAAEAQLKIANIEFQQMEKSDPDFTHALHAEQEYRNVILQYPDNRKVVAEAKKRLLLVQKIIGRRERFQQNPH